MRFSQFGSVCGIAVMLLLAVPCTRAAYTIDIQPVGADVVASGSGSLNYGPLTLVTTSVTSDSAVIPNRDGVLVGPTNASAVNSAVFTGISGPTSFGPGGITPASSGSGLPVGIDGLGGSLIVPNDYIGGSIPGSTDV